MGHLRDDWTPQFSRVPCIREDNEDQERTAAKVLGSEVEDGKSEEHKEDMEDGKAKTTAKVLSSALEDDKSEECKEDMEDGKAKKTVDSLFWPAGKLCF